MASRAVKGKLYRLLLVVCFALVSCVLMGMDFADRDDDGEVGYRYARATKRSKINYGSQDDAYSISKGTKVTEMSEYDYSDLVQPKAVEEFPSKVESVVSEKRQHQIQQSIENGAARQKKIEEALVRREYGACTTAGHRIVDAHDKSNSSWIQTDCPFPTQDECKGSNPNAETVSTYRTELFNPGTNQENFTKGWTCLTNSDRGPAGGSRTLYTFRFLI